MKRIPILVAVVVLLAVLLVACASSGKTTESVKTYKMGTEDSPFLKQFLDAGALVQFDQGAFISLKKDLHLPEGTSLVLDTGEQWNLNLNGHTIYRDKGDDDPAIIVRSGSLFVVTYRPEKYNGGIESNDGLCIKVEKDGVLNIQAGTISGGDYAVEVMEGGTLKVRDGRIQARKYPVIVQFGWVGNFTGGLFSRYHEAYDQAILGDAFASVRFLKEDRDFKNEWPEGFRVVNGHKYSGISRLTISSVGGYSTCYRLYREQDVDDVLRSEKPEPAYEWFMYAGQAQTMDITSGSYIVKVAEGYTWSDENAFGDKGIYWTTEPIDFEDGKVYSISRQNGVVDSPEGFLNP